MTRIAMILASVLLIAACGGGQVANAPTNTDPARQDQGAAMPGDFAISVGSGGGFTGEWGWKHVAADGTVKVNDTPAGKIDDSARKAIWVALQKLVGAEFERGPGNMTSAVRYTADSKEGYLDTPNMPNEGPFGEFTSEFDRLTAK